VDLDLVGIPGAAGEEGSFVGHRLVFQI
jgi:hypothetical protein